MAITISYPERIDGSSVPVSGDLPLPEPGSEFCPLLFCGLKIHGIVILRVRLKIRKPKPNASFVYKMICDEAPDEIASRT
jgi:hypothetical protein